MKIAHNTLIAAVMRRANTGASFDQTSHIITEFVKYFAYKVTIGHPIIVDNFGMFFAFFDPKSIKDEMYGFEFKPAYKMRKLIKFLQRISYMYEKDVDITKYKDVEESDFIIEHQYRRKLKYSKTTKPLEKE